MSSALETHHWLSRFAMRLMELRPDVSFRAAVARAAAAYAHAKNLSPEDAAQIDVEAFVRRGRADVERFAGSAQIAREGAGRLDRAAVLLVIEVEDLPDLRQAEAHPLAPQDQLQPGAVAGGSERNRLSKFKIQRQSR